MKCGLAIELQTLRRPCAATAPFVGRVKPYNGTFGMESMMVVKAEDFVRTSTTTESSAPTLEM